MRMHSNKEKVNLSFSSNDLMIFWNKCRVKVVLMFLTRSVLPGGDFSTAFSNILI